MKKLLGLHTHYAFSAIKIFFWFLVGALLGLFFFLSFLFIYFEKRYENKVYPGVMVNGIILEGKTKQEVRDYFANKNALIGQVQFTFISPEDTATISARELKFGYNEDLLANQAFSVGRSEDLLTNIGTIFESYINGINLSPSYQFSEESLNKLLGDIIEKIKIDPVNALFNFDNGKVLAFKASADGQAVDQEALKRQLLSKTVSVFSSNKHSPITIGLPIKVLHPKITTEKVNNLGIKELIAEGTSLFQHSIETRIYNISLAASRVNGILVAPGETFSFGKVLGDVSAFTGYKQAYVIQNGRTVLGDGGGICQVSTTLFRALLNAGFPIIERNAHAYRVGYYEQDSPPGIDATVYVPSVDLKFKNDTGHYILLQNYLDPAIQRLTFMIYGTKDGREVTLTKPVITSQTQAPEPLYQDDPTLPQGVEKQVDFAAAGANVSFSRTVTKNNKIIINETFVSHYRPWQAVFLRGTKE